MMGTPYLEWVRCGKSTCRKCPHGPYLYRRDYIDGIRRKVYMGREATSQLYLVALTNDLLRKREVPFWFLIGCVGGQIGDDLPELERCYKRLGNELKGGKRDDRLVKMTEAAFAMIALRKIMDSDPKKRVTEPMLPFPRPSDRIGGRTNERILPPKPTVNNKKPRKVKRKRGCR